MANARNKKVDTTYLSLEQAEKRGFLHRDYLAHCHRWSHVVKWVNTGKRYETAKIIDVGCGRELPLAQLLYVNKHSPKQGCFVGVDVGPIDKVNQSVLNQTQFPLELHAKTDVADLQPGFSPLAPEGFTLATCFEVLEHIEPDHMLDFLEAVKRQLAPGGTFIMSTPNYDEKTGAADNHVNEMDHQFLHATLQRAGWTIINKYGTFASQRDIKPLLERDGLMPVYEKLHAFYDSNVLSTVFAPLYPEAARNCLWELTPNTGVAEDPEDLVDFPTDRAWGSSQNAEAWANFKAKLGLQQE